jgi:glycosyltransferase involved in cell wall biosynthesis
MRILIESYNCVKQYPSGGVQVRIKNYISCLQKKNVEVKLFDKWNDKIEDYDILHLFRLTTEDFQLLHLAKEHDIPIVISSVIPLENALHINLNLLLCRLLPIHTNYSFMKSMMALADSIIAQTDLEADFISRNYRIQGEKIIVIPNGVNPIVSDNKISTLIFKYLNIDKPYILQVGRFDSNKNQLSIIRALKNSDIPVVFIGGSFAGEPDYYEKCKQEATENMFFLGWVENSDPLLASAYLNAQVVVLPSFKEIFGNSLIEGGAAGANLVATRELPIDQWGISEYCMKINPNNVLNVKENLLKSYSTQKKTGVKDFFCNKFSWDKVAEKHIDLYTKLMLRR